MKHISQVFLSFAGCALLVFMMVRLGPISNFIVTHLGYPPLDDGGKIFGGAVFLMIAICVIAAISAPQEALKFLGCVLLLLLIPLMLTGFPGMTEGWRDTWWKRLLDLLANLIWGSALCIAVALGGFHPTGRQSLSWWQLWLLVLIPAVLARAIRWTIVFVVQGPAKPEPPPPNPELKAPEGSKLPRSVRFLPALPKRPAI